MATKQSLSDIYAIAARAALSDGESARNQSSLTCWIRDNCNYEIEKEYFLVLGIGAALADLESHRDGYKNEVDRAFAVASARVSRKGYSD